jgi:hypothetical protein
MKPPRKYASATAFRVALESRLKKMAQEEGLDLQRLWRQAAFDRLLRRVFAIPGVSGGIIRVEHCEWNRQDGSAKFQK